MLSSIRSIAAVLLLSLVAVAQGSTYNLLGASQLPNHSNGRSATSGTVEYDTSQTTVDRVKVTIRYGTPPNETVEIQWFARPKGQKGGKYKVGNDEFWVKRNNDGTWKWSLKKDGVTNHGIVGKTPEPNSVNSSSVNEGDFAPMSVGTDDLPIPELSFSWAQTGGPQVTLTTSEAFDATTEIATATASFTAPELTANASLTFQLTITDAWGYSKVETIVVNVAADDDAPVAFYEGQTYGTAGEILQLEVVASDPDSTVLTYSWTQLSGTTGSFSSTSVVDPTFHIAVGSIPGETIQLQLVVSDGVNLTTLLVDILVY